MRPHTVQPASEGGNLRQRVAEGAFAGLSVWVAYGTAELIFVAIVTRLLGSRQGPRLLHLEESAFVLLLFATLGAAIGAAVAISARSLRPAPLATASVAAVFAGYQVIQWKDGPSLLPLFLGGIAAVLAVALLLAAAPNRWRHLRFLESPLAVGLLLAAPPWITKDLLKMHHPTTLRIGTALAFCAIVVGLAFLARRRKRRTAGWVVAARTVVAAAAIFGTAVYLNRLPVGRSAPVGGPPVILIVLDTVRADRLSLLGHTRNTSPRLEEFARDAVVYPRAIAAGDMTLSTHASLFTGKYAREHGAHHAEFTAGAPAESASVLSESFETLAEILAERGYRTWGVVANSGYLAPFFRLDQGFDYWDSRPASGWSSARYYLRHGIVASISGRSRSPFDSYAAFRSADEINREAIELLERAGSARGLFLFLNYMDAHSPYLPPPPFHTRFEGFDPSFSVEDLESKRRDLPLRGGKLTEAERRHLLSQYDGSIAYLDSQLGILMDHLKVTGVYDEALIVITSDHGEAFGERGFTDHGVSVYQDQVGIPLLAKYPRSAQTGVSRQTVSTVDVLPTVLDTVGILTPEDVSGRSLRGGRDEPRPVISEHYPRPRFAAHDPRYATVERAIVSGRFKLIRSSSGSVQLFDLTADPLEEDDLATTAFAEVEVELLAHLDRWLEDTIVGTDEERAPDLELREQLKALGYIQ